jgi:tetratricopeptide (TPR) repeat protein
MRTIFGGSGKRVALAVIATMTAISFSAPVFAVDTGGGGNTTSTSAPAMAPAAKPKMAVAPKVVVKPVALLDLNDARKLIAKSEWDAAITMLRKIVVQQPKNADALNLLGYSLRQHGDMKEAEAWYLKALKLQPTHLGANEYLGELYVLTGEKAKAQARLDALAKICGNTTCSEYQDLAKAIAAKA